MTLQIKIFKATVLGFDQPQTLASFEGLPSAVILPEGGFLRFQVDHGRLRVIDHANNEILEAAPSATEGGSR
jgi:hypothetical protein